MEEDKSILRWGGLAGITGSFLLIIVFAVVIVFAGQEPAATDGPIARFPDIRVARTVENGLYLVVVILWVALALALYRRLNRTSPAPALFGSALTILGLALLAAGALPHVATVRLSDLYHTPTATPTDKAALALTWHATQGVFDALFLAGLLVMLFGVVLLGVAMQHDPAFGKGLGKVSTALGAIGLAAGTVALVDPTSQIAALGVFALLAFHLILGWKVYRL